MVHCRVSTSVQRDDKLVQIIQQTMAQALTEQNQANKEATDALEARLSILENENTELKESIKTMTKDFARLLNSSVDPCDIKHLHQKIDGLKGDVEWLDFKVAKPITKATLLAINSHDIKVEMLKQVYGALRDSNEKLQDKVELMEVEMKDLTTALEDSVRLQGKPITKAGVSKKKDEEPVDKVMKLHPAM